MVPGYLGRQILRPLNRRRHIYPKGHLGQEILFTFTSYDVIQAHKPRIQDQKIIVEEEGVLSPFMPPRRIEAGVEEGQFNIPNPITPPPQSIPGS